MNAITNAQERARGWNLKPYSFTKENAAANAREGWRKRRERAARLNTLAKRAEAMPAQCAILERIMFKIVGQLERTKDNKCRSRLLADYARIRKEWQFMAGIPNARAGKRRPSILEPAPPFAPADPQPEEPQTAPN